MRLIFRWEERSWVTDVQEVIAVKTGSEEKTLQSVEN